MGKTKMGSKVVGRIQSHSDKSGRNQGFKARAQSAAAKNKKWVDVKNLAPIFFYFDYRMNHGINCL